MRVVRSGVYLGFLLLPGCSVGEKLVNNVIVEPAHYNRWTDRVGRCLRDKSLAEEAWDEVCARDGEAYSRHYYRGFVEGFHDYLDSGGTGDPPSLPPRSYWRVYYQSPEGHQAIEDWFAGFRHGAAVAKASGVRNLVTVPVSSIPPSEISDTSGSGGTNDSRLPLTERNAGDTPTQTERLPGPTPSFPPVGPPAPTPPIRPGGATEGPVTPPRTANGKPMPPPSPPVIQVERMLAPPVPKKPK